MKALVFDIEANGLLDTVTEAYCFVGRELNTNSVVQLLGTKEIEEQLPTLLSSYSSLIGHNIIGYDIPLLEKLYGMTGLYDTHKVVDTLVLSCLMFPDRVGGHSVEAWATRFGMEKVGNEDWSRYDPVMLERCKSDVLITQQIYNRVMWESEQ
jgi:DNA polymerase III alpha subunit (gram-positive type)